MGWLFFLLAAAATLSLLVWRGGRRVTILVAPALIAAAAGYAWQGQPRLVGSPTKPRATHPADDQLFAAERKVWLETVGPEAQVLDAADNFIRAGDPDYAVGILRGAVKQAPNSMTLWLGLGNALVTYADGSVTPAARYAFGRANALAPRHPAPPYFLGLAYAQEGAFDTASTIWTGLLAETPADAPYRPLIAERIATLRQLRAMQGQR